MEYRVLGNSGIRVSPVCLGSAWFGVDQLEEDVPFILNRAVDLGINFFDCANTYGTRGDRPDRKPHGERRSAEELLGNSLKHVRDQVIITSKVQEAVGSGPNDGGPSGGGLSRLHIRRQVEQSLRRLAMDYIDVYYAHHPDPTTPIEETVRAFDELIREGKIRYYALSDFQSWHIVHFIAVAERYGLNKPICLQMPYNLANRSVEGRIADVCETFDLTMAAFMPLGGGLLGGRKSRTGEYVGMRRATMPGHPRRDSAFSPEDVLVAEGLEDLSDKWGHPASCVALAWLLNRPAVSTAILGASSVSEVETAVSSLQVRLDDEQMADLNALDSRRASTY